MKWEYSVAFNHSCSSSSAFMHYSAPSVSLSLSLPLSLTFSPSLPSSLSLSLIRSQTIHSHRLWVVEERASNSLTNLSFATSALSYTTPHWKISGRLRLSFLLSNTFLTHTQTRVHTKAQKHSLLQALNYTNMRTHTHTETQTHSRLHFFSPPFPLLLISTLTRLSMMSVPSIFSTASLASRSSSNCSRRIEVAKNRDECQTVFNLTMTSRWDLMFESWIVAYVLTPWIVVYVVTQY